MHSIDLTIFDNHDFIDLEARVIPIGIAAERDVCRALGEGEVPTFSHVGDHGIVVDTGGVLDGQRIPHRFQVECVYCQY